MSNKFTVNNLRKRNYFKPLALFMTLMGLMLVCMHVFADSGVDLLKGTETDLVATVKGTGKLYLYIAELIVATVLFVKSRDPKMFLGVLVLSVGFNVLLKIAGI